MPTSLSQVVLVLVSIIPGFVLIRVKRIAYPTAEPSATNTVLDSLALSCITYALASPLLYLAYLGRWYVARPTPFTIVAFFVLLILPAILGVSYVRLTESGKMRWLREFLRFPHPDPTAWDYHFRKGRAYWVWLTFKSGKVIAGLFGPNSFASSFPHKRDLYVEKLLRLDEKGDVVELIENSSGVLVAMEDLELIEFFEFGEVKL